MILPTTGQQGPTTGQQGPQQVSSQECQFESNTVVDCNGTLFRIQDGKARMYSMPGYLGEDVPEPIILPDYLCNPAVPNCTSCPSMPTGCPLGKAIEGRQVITTVVIMIMINS